MDKEGEVSDQTKERRYPQRIRRMPIRFDDYYPQRVAVERGPVVPAPEMSVHRVGSL